MNSLIFLKVKIMNDNKITVKKLLKSGFKQDIKMPQRYYILFKHHNMIIRIYPKHDIASIDVICFGKKITYYSKINTLLKIMSSCENLENKYKKMCAICAPKVNKPLFLKGKNYE
jgi:hypothetical protein